ncbi:MAG: DMT family transporter, partial [Oscillospiraceae bacterium]|nr:DMT family transporter [Oscillospiraceae bacterium]
MKGTEVSKARLGLIASALIFGTIGLVKRFIPLPSAYVSLARAVIGFAVLLIFQIVRGKKIDFAAIKRNFIIILVSGAAIGFNWILLFEAYNYTSVAAATLCYYMAPLMVVLVSPVLLKEKLSVQKIVCVIFALGGMVLVNGTGEAGTNSVKGALLGLAAAVLYASVMILNKKMKDIGAWDRTMMQ